MAEIPALIRAAVPLAALAVLAACDHGAGTASAAAAGGGGGAARNAGGTPTASAASAGAVVRTAARPADACGWIPAAEVAAIVGPLDGPPRPSPDGCVYPLPLDSSTARRRAAVLALRQKLEERFGKSEIPLMEPDESAVIVDVQVCSIPDPGTTPAVTPRRASSTS